MKSIVRLAFLYAAFAIIATAANLSSQALVIWLYKGVYAIEASILIGTIVGLPIKYLLEKQHIFAFTTDNFAHDSKLFLIYSFVGIFTTALFWSVEYTFQRQFGTDAMRYLGGGIGLTLGYIIKYHLDKRFVFIEQPRSSATGPR